MSSLINFLVNAVLFFLSLLLGYLLGFVLNCLWAPILRKIYRVDKILPASELPIGFKKSVEYLSNLSIGISMGIIHSIMVYKYSIYLNYLLIFYILFCFMYLAQEKWASQDFQYFELYATDNKIFIKLKAINILGYIITLYLFLNILFD